MISLIKSHLCDNDGLVATPNMILIAIAFVIGSIVLVTTTAAFKEPIQQWYETTVVEWFAGENGQYSYDEWAAYEKNENGTYKGLNYVLQFDNGKYVVIDSPGDLYNTSDLTDVFVTEYNADGKAIRYPCYFVDKIKISSDGRSITLDDQVYHAQLP